ncbi:MAG: AgmX/PglI C-terminal domain-containing protein [Sandaracinus sp.]|nr:AgmX/PglI C-terminal domain-containing protein [Sandaracinus sp.]MCB9634968.1 AgmX/PglI C-terminal domain-containing protein [Sandaracinus sp.]
MTQLRALEAYAAGLLSPAGVARVEAKLTASPELRAVLAQVRAYRSVVEEAAALTKRATQEAARVDLERPLAERLAAARALDVALVAARQIEGARVPDESSLAAALAASRALDTILSETRDASRTAPRVPNEAAVASAVASAHALDAALASAASADTPPLDAERVEAGVRHAIAAEQALGNVLAAAREPALALDFAKLEASLFAEIAKPPAERSIPARAIAAYVDGRLSKEGRRRLEARAARQPEVADALARARSLGALTSDADRVARDAVMGTPLEKLELPLRREVVRLEDARRRRNVGVSVLALAAAAVLGWLVTHPAPVEAPVAEVEELPPASVLAAAELDAEVTAVAGEALAEGRDLPLALGDTLHEGEVLQVAGALHGRLDEGTGIVLAPGSSPLARVRIDRLRTDGVVLSLLQGRLGNQVRTGTPYAVQAGPYRVEVRGTRFSVDRVEDEIAVRLDEGRVAIERDGELLALLEAPAEWRSSPAIDVPGAVERPRALAEVDLRWPRFRLPSGRFVELEIDGSVLPASEGLAMRVPAGSQEVIAIDADGRRHRGVVEVQEGFVLDERALTPERTATRRGYLAPEVIRGVVAPRIESLKRCYERTLRRTNPELTGSYVLRVIVGTDGQVRRVRVVTEGETPPPFVACLQLEAQSWSFPRPEGDGPVTFDLPLAFTARGL